MHVGMSLVEVLCQVEEVYRMLQSQGLPLLLCRPPASMQMSHQDPAQRIGGNRSTAGHPDTESDHDPEKLVTLRLVTPEPTAATVPLPSAPSVKCCDFWFAANLHKHRITSPDSQALIGFSCVMI